MKIYFAHSMKDYDTKREKKSLKYLRERFPNIVCPNNDLNLGSKMENYLSYIRNNVNFVIFMPNKNNFIGKGVWQEIKEARNKNIPVFLLIRRFGKYHISFFDFTGKINETNWIYYVKVKAIK